jgi:UDP-sugar pyrophosphorylase
MRLIAILVVAHARSIVLTCIVLYRHKTDPDKSLVINVEYNQLDPLLRSQGDGQGDVNDPTTGYSLFPGNANNLILELSAYAKTLRGEDQGVVIEFVNPKYKDKTRTTFKKPTRLECMMQDLPKLIQKELGGTDANIGFTLLDRWLTFSPAKNALDAGQEAVQGGSTAPGTLSSAESEGYLAQQRLIRAVSSPDSNIPTSDLVNMAGIPITPGPRIVVDPSAGWTPSVLRKSLPGPLNFTTRSSLVVEGPNVIVKKLDLDGALVIRAGPESHVTVDGLSVKNKGWEVTELDESKEYAEVVCIRGYTMTKHETAEYVINEPGHYVIDGSGEMKKTDS